MVLEWNASTLCLATRNPCGQLLTGSDVFFAAQRRLDGPDAAECSPWHVASVLKDLR